MAISVPMIPFVRIHVRILKMKKARLLLRAKGCCAVHTNRAWMVLLLFLLLRMGALRLQRLNHIQNQRISALMHTVVLTVLLDAVGSPKILAVIISVRSSGWRRVRRKTS